ncbi:hypothetical protein I4F81_000703 [Pyropia yezoensis]|uniref:Uncharacterized protein n=1 Tax=Pyropia yezoensis TaxID=2788 RepID=A0ACC3BJH5_PYRYE|nr:hypothetical protein I4F81_000703 [Neopyropia yezoensis]
MASRRVPVFDGISSSRRRVTQRGASGRPEDTTLLIARAKEARAARAAARAAAAAASQLQAAGRGAAVGRRDVAARAAALGGRLAAAAAAAGPVLLSGESLPALLREALYVGTAGQAFVAGTTPAVLPGGWAPWLPGLAKVLSVERLAAAATAAAADDAGVGAEGGALAALGTAAGRVLLLLLAGIGARATAGEQQADADGDVTMDSSDVVAPLPPPDDDVAAVLAAVDVLGSASAWAPPASSAVVSVAVARSAVEWGAFSSFAAALAAPTVPVWALVRTSLVFVDLCLASAMACRGGPAAGAPAVGEGSLLAAAPRHLVALVLSRWAASVLAVPGLSTALSATELAELDRAPTVRETIKTLAASATLPAVAGGRVGADRPLARVLFGEAAVGGAQPATDASGALGSMEAARVAAGPIDAAARVAAYEAMLGNLLDIGRGAWTDEDAAYTATVMSVLVRLLCAVPGLTSRRGRGAGEGDVGGGTDDLDAASGMLDTESDSDSDAEVRAPSSALAAETPSQPATAVRGAGGAVASNRTELLPLGRSIGALRADLLSRLGPLLDEQVVRRLFDRCLPRLEESCTGAVASVGGGDVVTAAGETPASDVCQMLTLLARRRRNGSNLLCNSIAFWVPSSPSSPHVLLRLWAACSSVPLTTTKDGRTLVTAARSGTAAAASVSPMGLTLRPTCGPVLLLFCRAYAHLLSIQDEDEMYELQRPLSLVSVCAIATALKATLVASVCPAALGLRWGTPVVAGAVDLLSVRSVRAAVVDVLDRLHAADSRRRFVPGPSFWLAPARSLESPGFVHDAITAGAPPAAVDSAADAADAAGGANEGSDGASGAPVDRGFVVEPAFAVDPMSAAVIDVDDRRSFRFGGSRFGPAPLDGGVPKHGPDSGGGGRREQGSAVRSAGDLLHLCPYAVPFSTRVLVFHAWVAQRRIHSSASTWVTVRRSRLFEDALTHLGGLPDHALRSRVRVKFIDEHGLEEAGIDGGGVFKEFMHQLLATALSPSLYGLFKATDEQLLYPNPSSGLIMERHLSKFEFLGRMLAKAVFDGILVDVPLAGFVLAALLGRPYSPNDLRSLDPELHRNMMLVKRMDAADVDSLGLTFTAVDNEFGEAREVELVRGGRDKAVTGANRVEYIQRAAHHRLRQTRQQTMALRRGFGTLIDPRWSRLFGERELQLLLSGTRGAVDVADLQASTVYTGGYTASTPVIVWFWETVVALPADLQSALLLFVTSSPRAPLLGFRHLDPPFTIQRAHGTDRLPSASTCMNLLKLPEYGDAQTTGEKLRYALRSNAGFDLS